MRQVTGTELVLLLAAAGLALAACTPREAARPSLVLLSVDTLTPEALEAPTGGHPALDRLSAASLRFTNAVSTAPWTLPAHASLLTGLYPDRHGATDLRASITPSAQRLARLLRSAGYRTVAFTDGTYLDPLFGFAEGFDLYDGMPAPDASASVPDLPRGGRPNEVRGESLFDRAVAYLEARREQTPLFLFLHTFAVHDYPQLRPWVRAALPTDGYRSSAAFFDCLQGRSSCPDEMWAELEVAYRAEVAHLDEGVARLVGALDDAGLRDGSFFVLVSDHGEGFDFRLGRIHHGGRLHADQLRVPLWIAGPGVPAGETAAPVSLVDVMPTLLDLLGVPVPGGLDGRSLAAVAAGSAPDPELVGRARFAMEHYFFWEDGRRANASATRTEPFQVAVIQGPRWYIRDGERRELYDAGSDARQRVDLAPHVRDTAELEALAASRGRVAVERAPLEVPGRIVEELRGLGYVE